MSRSILTITTRRRNTAQPKPLSSVVEVEVEVRKRRIIATHLGGQPERLGEECTGPTRTRNSRINNSKHEDSRGLV